jgi:hypothetical protein
LIYFSEQTDGEISAIEKSTIIGRIKEWYEADGQENIDAHLEEVFNAAESVYKSDPSSERFAFALENIRRQFLVNYEWDQEKTHTQLLNVVKDFISVAAADDQVVEKEAELIQLIMKEWDINSKEIFGDDESDSGNEQSSATQSAEQTNDEKQESSDDEKGFPAISVFQFDDETINQKRVDYIRDWQMESRVYAHRAGIRAYIPEWIDQLDNNDCCPHFSATELEKIENIVLQHKIIPILNYAPVPFFDHVKRVWWIVPFCIWREDSLSWIMLDKNGFYCAHTEDNNIGQMLSWDSITDMEMEYAYDGDERVNMLTVHMGEGKFLTFAEFVSNEQGSYLAVVKAIYEVRKPTIEASRGQDTWKEGSGGEGYQTFEKAADLLKEKNWLENPDRPDPGFFA